MSYEYQYVKFKSDTSFFLPDGSQETYFVMCTQQADLGYGENTNTKILNKNLTIGDIRYQISSKGLQQVQNTSITFSNVDQFYHAMRELNGDDFWATLNITIYWANGRVPTLSYDGANWKEDGETIVAFTPTITYPLATDYIKKEFEGSMASASISRDKISLSLVSKSKQDSYLVGSIQSFNGADSSRGLITPIVVGDLTDAHSFVPLILKNPISSKSTALCSDLSLVGAPTPYIYDDENEKFHAVVNDQKATNNNKQIEFYNENVSDSFVTDGDFIETTKTAPTDGPRLYTLNTGEVVGYFTNTKDYVIFNDYADASNYDITTTANRLRDEGTRDNNNDGAYANGTENGFLVDADMALGIAKLNLALHPTNIKQDTPKGADISSPTSGSYIEFTQDPSGPNDFAQGNYVTKTQTSFFGSLKNFVNYRKTTANVSRGTPTYSDDTTAIWISGDAKEDETRILSTDWDYYNYNNKVRVGITADFEQFKYDSDIIDLDVSFYGAVYKNFEESIDADTMPIAVVNANPYRSYITMNYPWPSTGANVSQVIHDEDSRIDQVFNISDTNGIVYSKLSELYENPPNFTFSGFTTYNPVKTTTPWNDPPIVADCYLDRADPSFFGSTRFAIDGFRADVEVNARVESKYWCFKGLESLSCFLSVGLNNLATRYNSTAFNSRDTSRSTWLIAGAHTGNPIYYRDLIAQIADEFRVFITDENAGSEIVSMGLVTEPTFTIDESNAFSPWNSSVQFSETQATEIYNKIVVRYAKNHMTKRYGKTVAISADLVERSADIEVFEDVSELQSYLQIAKNTLSKIGITEKTKTIDLDWVRDDYTANQILKWWCKNSNKQRAKIKADVSKIQFINAKIGDVVDLSLPSLPEFYQVNYQITQIVNKSNKTISIEAEQIEALERGAVPLDRIEQSEISMLTVDNSNGQKTFQLAAYDTEGVDVTALVNWSSDDSAVSVGMNGLLTANSASVGSVTITAQSGAISKTCLVWSYASVPNSTNCLGLRGGYGNKDAGGTGGSLVDFESVDVLSTRPNSISGRMTFKHRNSWFLTASSSINGGFSIGPELNEEFAYHNFVSGSYTRYDSTFKLNLNDVYDYDFSIGSEGVKLNGSTFSSTSSSSSYTAFDRIRFRFANVTQQNTHFSFDSGSLSVANLNTISLCENYYIAQDYIRYSDTATKTNYVVIPNRGTLSGFDLPKNNVPQKWFDGI